MGVALTKANSQLHGLAVVWGDKCRAVWASDSSPAPSASASPKFWASATQKKLTPIHSFMGSRLSGTTKVEEVGSDAMDRSGIEKENGRAYILARPLNAGRVKTN